jgi:hypothetical protein
MRNKKITADISEEAKELLQNQAREQERSYGWIIDSLIKEKFKKKTEE